MSLFRKTFTPSVDKVKDKEGEILDIDYRRKVDPSYRDGFGRSQLHKVLLQEYDDPEEIDYLISNGCDVNLLDCDHCSPIHIAADKGLVKCTKKLVQRNSLLDVFNKKGLSPLMLSCLKGFTDVVSILLQKGANPNLPNSFSKTAFHYAAMGGNVETVKLILDAKGKVNKVDSNKFTPLTLASKMGHTKVVELLLKYPCTPKLNPNLRDSYGRTSVHWAAAAGLHDIVAVLCDSGVELDIADSHFATPFILSIRNNRPKVLEVLLKYKVDRSTPDGLNGTCLGLAALFGHNECAKILLDAGEDPDETAYFGLTPLIGAVYESSVKSVETLLTGGADPNVSGRLFVAPLLKSLLSISQSNDVERHTIVKMLIRHGADTNFELTKGKCMRHLCEFVHGNKDLMSFAVITGYTSIVTLLLLGGCNVTKTWLNDIEQGPLSKNGLFEITEMLTPVRQWLEQPRSLSHLTRSVIRKSLGPKSPQLKLQQLPLAWKLKQYVNYEEFDSVQPERVKMRGEMNIDDSLMINLPPCAIESFKGTITFQKLAPNIGVCNCNVCVNFEENNL